jgi:hypothetical protein
MEPNLCNKIFGFSLFAWVLLYPTTFGGFDTNYIIFRNVEFFFNFLFQITKMCEGKLMNLQVYFICWNENFKINQFFNRHTLTKGITIYYNKTKAPHCYPQPYTHSHSPFHILCHSRNSIAPTLHYPNSPLS